MVGARNGKKRNKGGRRGARKDIYSGSKYGKNHTVRLLATAAAQQKRVILSCYQCRRLFGGRIRLASRLANQRDLGRC